MPHSNLRNSKQFKLKPKPAFKLAVSLGIAASGSIASQSVMAMPLLEFTDLSGNTIIAEPSDNGVASLNIGVSLRGIDNSILREYDKCTVTGSVFISSENATNNIDYRTPSTRDFSLSLSSVILGAKTDQASLTKVTAFDNDEQEILFEVLPDNDAEPDEVLNVEIIDVIALCEVAGDNNGGTFDVTNEIVNTTEYGYGATITIEDTFNERPINPEQELNEVPEEQLTLKTQVQDMSQLGIHTGLIQARRLGSELENIRKGKRGLNVDNLQVSIDGTAMPAFWNYQNTKGEEKGAGAGDALNDFGRWGVFLSGAVEIGEQLNSDNDNEYTSSLILAGADYHFTDNFVGGAAFGYTNLNSELASDLASTDFTKINYFAFASYYKESFYFDAIAGYGITKYDLARKVLSDNLIADTDGKELNASVGTGYQFNIKRSALNLFALVNYVDASVNAYSETTDGLELTADVNNFNTQSIISSFGAQISWPINTSFAVISPQFSVAWEHQYEENPVSITGNFIGEGISQAFEFETSKLDQDYYSAQVGLTAAFKHGISGYFTYDTYVDRNDLHSEMYSFGLRGQF